jgi:DNA invertase Pin-like site-specific DNA recombinase
LYARISHDPAGTEKGVRRQLEDAHLLAELRGWDVADEYIDNDTSAYKRRDAYERMMADALGGKVDRIVVWHTSRLWRNRSERGAAIDRLGAKGIVISPIRGSELDLGTAQGRMMAGVVGEFDSNEVEVKVERQKRANVQKAQEGRRHAWAPYGWRREYETDSSGRTIGFHDVEHEDEAAVVREIAERLLSSETMRAIIQDLNRREVPPPSRRQTKRGWNHMSLKSVLLRPSNVGLYAHYRDRQPEIVGAAAAPAILDRDIYDRVVALLKDPARAQRRDGRRHYLLSGGVGECAKCGGQLWHRQVRARHSYRCDKGCVHRDMLAVDALVGEVVVERLSRPDAAGIFDADDDLAREARSRAEGVRARLNGAADAYAEGTIDGAQMARITARLRPELEAAEDEARRHTAAPLPPSAPALQGERAAETWAALDVVQKRLVLEALRLKVRILPRKKAGPGFEPESVEFGWAR